MKRFYQMGDHTIMEEPQGHRTVHVVIEAKSREALTQAVFDYLKRWPAGGYDTRLGAPRPWANLSKWSAAGYRTNSCD